MITSFRELTGRYLEVLRHSWGTRGEVDRWRRRPVEVAFLPAHLEIVETPPHPAPRWTARIVALLGVSVVALAIFGHLDIVAVASGKLVPNARVKVIQPAITGVVRRILVQDGMRVRAGQLLMELDPTQAQADTNKATSARLDAELTVARAQALLTALTRSARPHVASVADAPAERQGQTQDYADGLYSEYRAKIASLQAELAKRAAELAATNAEIVKFRETLPLAEQQASDYRALSSGNYVARHDYLEKEQDAISQAQELAAQSSHARELEAAIDEQESDIATTTAEFRSAQLDDIGKAQEVLSQASSDQTKAEVRESRMRLVAPVSGTVQQLSVHTVGGVVTTAQSLLEIVPDDPLEVEASLQNKDIGFVQVGQPAVIKIDAFPYTRFGYLKGTVEEVSDDAVSDKKSGLYFIVRIKLPSRQFRIRNRWVNLTPGMQVRAEIATGKRSVAEYFLSPVMVAADESLHER